jgi:hypothetical protein
MGYYLNSLGNLPIDDDISFYIFVVNGNWKEPLYNMIQENFAHIARNIGDRAVIAMGLEPASWGTQIAATYLGKDHSEFFGLLPALIITNAHPKNLTDDSLRLIVPLRDIEKRFGGWPEFFRLMSSFVRLEDDEFLRRFKDKEDAFELLNRVVNVKPGLFGVSINVNELAATWWRKRQQAIT